MCTVTSIPVPGGLRVVCNRDERTARPQALSPRLVRAGGRTALMPVDGQAGGTWVMANDAGLAVTLLNVNAAGAVRPGVVSRGLIVRDLTAATDVAEALARVAALPLTDFAPFRLLLLSQAIAAEFVWTGSATVVRPLDPQTPLLATSSGLGDTVVETPRRRLFERTLARRPDAATQDAFHAHHWPDRPHLSVAMARPGFRTVSRTTVTLAAGGATMGYVAIGPDLRPSMTAPQSVGLSPPTDREPATSTSRAAG